jgi:hypothetical protein
MQAARYCGRAFGLPRLFHPCAVGAALPPNLPDWVRAVLFAVAAFRARCARASCAAASQNRLRCACQASGIPAAGRPRTRPTGTAKASSRLRTVGTSAVYPAGVEPASSVTSRGQSPCCSGYANRMREDVSSRVGIPAAVCSTDTRTCASRYGQRMLSQVVAAYPTVSKPSRQALSEIRSNSRPSCNSTGSSAMRTDRYRATLPPET